MAEENNTKDTAPVKEKTKKKEKVEAAAVQSEEKKEEKVVKKATAKPKKPGFFRSIFNFIFYPFIKVYERIALALSNTKKRIVGAIMAVCRFIKNIFLKLWEVMKKAWVILKKLLIVFLILGVIAGGFFLGMYLRLFNLDDLNRGLQLYKWPVIGENFVEPPPLEEPEQTGDDAKKDGKDKNGKVEDVRPNAADSKTPTIKVTKEEIEKQMKESAKAEKKRVSKLARLYENMKPQEAATIMEDVEDVIIVAVLQKMEESQAAKILAKIEPAKAARLTRMIYGGPTSLRRGQTNR